jgi:hypothetical protein
MADNALKGALFHAVKGHVYSYAVCNFISDGATLLNIGQNISKRKLKKI